MRRNWRWFLLITVVLSSYFIAPVPAQAEPLKFNTSTQLLWGDDFLAESQSILVQYLRFSFNPEGTNFSMTGYGRLWQDFSGGAIRDDDSSGRIYYLYMDYSPLKNTSLRLGRQYVNFTAGSSIMDGISLDVTNIGPVGITVSGGKDVRFSLDSEHSRLGNYFVGIDVHLENIRSTQLGISYVRLYDEWDRAREEFGLNFRYFYKYFSPYAELRYDRLSETIDEAVVGLSLFPLSNLMIKGEFYLSYPTFDSTSIYSVFAVDKYREYLLRAEYSLDSSPVTGFASYTSQTYEDSEDADLYTVGARIYPSDRLTLNASVDYRNGFGGNLWGFELFGDYRLKKKLALSAGAQYDTYRRPDFSDNNYDYAQRYWIGGQWLVSKKVSVSARIEDNINENFDHRPSGRITLNWSL